MPFKEIITQIEDAIKEIDKDDKANFIPCSFCKHLIKNMGKLKSLCPKCNSYT